MLSALVLATLVSAAPQGAAAQPLSVLHIKIVLVDPDGKATPVPRHALLISDNPASAAPRRIITTLDGTADVQLRPGSYTVESDKPVAFHGKAYQWTQIVNLRTSREATLELTAGNAEVEAITSTTTTAATSMETDPLTLLMPWQDSVVALWTPTTHASAFVIDARGLVATNQRVVGSATSVEVQLTPAIKVEGRVLASDPARDVAVLWIDPKTIASVRPLALGCGQDAKPVLDGQEIFTIGTPLRELKGITSGTVRDVTPNGIVFDARLPLGSAGGPVFSADGKVLGISAAVDEKDDTARGDSRVVRVDAACEVVASAEKKLSDAPPPGTHLPIEPTRPFPVDALKDAAQRRVGSLNPYQLSSSDFDINFITPVMTYGVQYQAEQASRRDRTKGSGKTVPEPPFVSPLMDFSNWSEYVSDFPPVLLVRVTPRMVEGFWTKVARGAAQTQGMSIPPIKRLTSGFSRMQAYCGDTEVTPIHRFKLARQLSEASTMYEGLYVFDPGAFGPQCATVKLVVYSEKEPAKGETREVDSSVIEQIKQDFAPLAAK